MNVYRGPEKGLQWIALEADEGLISSRAGSGTGRNRNRDRYPGIARGIIYGMDVQELRLYELHNVKTINDYPLHDAWA